ncbi:antitoxin [Skermanella pratensis]|uniref:antitoxin n=1 Tax=Skermanella pratensis TaxID=2233999 RepID=UPI003CCCA954
MPGDEAIMHRDGDRLVLEPVPRHGLLALLATWEPLDEELPEVTDEPVKPEDVF